MARITGSVESGIANPKTVRFFSDVRLQVPGLGIEENLKIRKFFPVS